MPNKNYNNGRAKEYRIKKKLEKENWFVLRSAGSHTKIDLIAIMGVTTEAYPQKKPFRAESPIIRFIQCKPKGGYLNPKERKEKLELERKLGINIEVM